MKMGVWTVLALGLSVAATGAQTHAAHGQMDGMGMGQAASHARTAAAGMDMSHGMGAAPGNALPAGGMRITFGPKSADWTPAALAVLPHKTVTVHNEHTKADETYSGVPLIDLLVKLGVPEKPHGKDLAFYLVAAGSDGYKAVYSVGEINPDVHDAAVIVADSMDGKPLAADGPLKLVATRETRPARWVRNLVSIKVLAAQ